MWRHEARNFLRVPNSMLPLFAPLSRPHVEHLMTLEYQPFRRRHISTWPTSEEVLSSLLTHVIQERTKVFKYMDTFARLDLKRGVRSFPSNKWLLEILAEQTPGNRKNSDRTFEDWREKGLLRREYEGGPWELSSVASLLIMRSLNKTHIQGWMPKFIDEDETWWCYSKISPDGPVLTIPHKKQDENNVPLLLWTPHWLGAGWHPDRLSRDGIIAWWSCMPSRAMEIALWNIPYADEIDRQQIQTNITVGKALQVAEQDADLLFDNHVQETIKSNIKRIQKEVQQSMLNVAARRILVERAPKLAKEKLTS